LQVGLRNESGSIPEASAPAGGSSSPSFRSYECGSRCLSGGLRERVAVQSGVRPAIWSATASGRRAFARGSVSVMVSAMVSIHMCIADPRQVPSGLFLYTLRPIRLAMLTDGATPDEQALAAQHWAYSQNLLAQGTLIFAGRTLQQDPTTFAFVVIRAPSLDAARVLAERDPAVAGGVFATEVFPFQPMLMGEWPAEAATVPPAP